MKPTIVRELEGLIAQATTERSHYYVRSVAEKAILAIGMQANLIEDLEDKLKIAILALSHPWLNEELDCTCGYYGEDSEDSGISQCPKCLIKDTLVELNNEP